MKDTVSSIGEINSIADAHLEIDRLVRIVRTINKTACQMILDAPQATELTEDVLCLLSAESDELAALTQIVEIFGELAAKA